MMTVEAAVREPDFRPQGLLEDLSLESANVSIFLGQFLVGAVVLAQNRQRSVASNFDVIAAAKQRIAQPLHPVLQVLLAEPTQARYQGVANARCNRLPNLGVGNIADFAPENQSQIAVIVA